MSADPAHAASRQGVRPSGSDTQLRVIATPGFADYALVDSGNGRKLERFGRFTVDRPEPQAMWQPALEPGVWLRADAVFKSAGDEEDGDGGRWRKDKPMPETWPLRVLDATVLCRLTSFRHLGVFPEQLPHWEWMRDRLKGQRGEPPRVLNLFAYTGAASLIAARAGAEVTHVDASKRAIAWAKQNQAVSKLDEAPIRWILDDARKFVAREVQARQDLQPDPRRPAEVRARAGRRGLGCVPAPGPAVARLRGAPRLPPLGAGAHDLRHPRLRTRHRRPGARMPGRRAGARPRAESSPSSRRRADACCRPRSTRAGPRTMPPDPRRGQVRAITSLQNERVKLIRSLEMRKARRETGLFVAEGASVLVTARDAGWVPKILVFLAGSAQAGVHRALLDWAQGCRRGVPGGVGSRARQARRQGQPADHARRIRAALGQRAGPFDA